MARLPSLPEQKLGDGGARGGRHEGWIHGLALSSRHDQECSCTLTRVAASARDL